MEHMDAVLAEIAARAEVDSSYSIGLSILVDGVFVSGTITSSAAFRAALRLGKAADPEELESVAEPLAPLLPTYIHLRNVKFYAGSGQQIEERCIDSFWRCRISAATGFKLGTLHFMAARVGESDPRRRLTEA